MTNWRHWTVFMIGSSLLSLSINVHAHAAIKPHIPHLSAAKDNPDNKPHILPYIHIDGNIRSYYFDRNYGLHHLHNRHAFSLGGKLNALTDEFFNYFRVGGTLYTAQPLGLNSDDPRRVDTTLPGGPVTVVGQAFLQFQNAPWLIRMGDQLITTPWMNEADSRMIPAAYQGVYAKFTPMTDLDFTAMRMFRFKSRISSSFTQTNLYSPVEGATPVPALANKRDIGALAFGGQYTHATFHAEVWGYQFYDFGDLLYGDASYTIPTGTMVRPIIGAQLAGEWSDGNQSLFRAKAGKTDATIYGALIGAEIANGSLTVGYNNIPKRRGAFKNGDVVSPYTTNYMSDPLYTTSMIAGLVEKAAGSAGKVTAQYTFCDKQLHLLASYARYITSPFIPNTTEEDFDAIYMPNGQFKNLSLRYRVGLLTNNPTYGRFVYNRLMVQYDFS